MPRTPAFGSGRSTLGCPPSNRNRHIGPDGYRRKFWRYQQAVQRKLMRTEFAGDGDYMRARRRIALSTARTARRPHLGQQDRISGMAARRKLCTMMRGSSGDDPMIAATASAKGLKLSATFQFQIDQPVEVREQT